MSGGRPSLYSKEICDKICLLISSSDKGLHRICKENKDLPEYATIFGWLCDKDKKEFLDNYARAREEQSEFLAEQIIEISDDSTGDKKIIYKGDEAIEVEDTEFTSRSKLRVESRKWIASKLKPKKYGDKIDVTGAISQTITNVTPNVVDTNAPIANKESDIID